MEKKLTLIQGGISEQSENKEKLQEELDDLEKQYSCGINSNSNYFIYGTDQYNNKNKAIIHWIAECEEEKMIAHRIADLINRLDGKVEIKKSEEYEDLAKKMTDEYLDQD